MELWPGMVRGAHLHGDTHGRRLHANDVDVDVDAGGGASVRGMVRGTGGGSGGGGGGGGGNRRMLLQDKQGGEEGGDGFDDI